MSMMTAKTEKNMNYYTQIFSSLGVCFGHLVLGTLIGYPTIAIPQLKNELNENLKLEDDLRSWFAPTFHICAIIFMMPGGILSSKFGRRKIMLFTMPFIMAGWLLIGLAQNKIMIFSGRILSNSFSCLSCTSISVYISETVHPNIRGSLVVCAQLFLASGYLMVWGIGYKCSWQTVAFCGIAPCCVVILTLIFLPETPYWLIENNQFEEAKKSLKFFRGTNYDTSTELEEIHQKHLSKPKSQTFSWVMRRLFSQAFFRPFLCIGMLEILFSISGFEIVTLYMHRILETTQSSIDPALGPVITGVVRVISAGFMPLVFQKSSPRILFTICQFISTISLGTLGIFSYYSQYLDLHFLKWLPVISINVIALMRAIGSFPVMHSLVNEVYPTEIRTQSIALTDTICLAFGAINLKVYPDFERYVEFHGAVLLYTILSLILASWGAYSIPDNRGKSLVKVEETFEKNSNIKDDSQS